MKNHQPTTIVDSHSKKNETNSTESTPVVIQDKIYSEKDKKRIEIFREKRKNSKPPSLVYIKDKDTVEPGDKDPKFLRVGLSEAFGTVNTALQGLLLEQLRSISPRESHREVRDTNALLAVLHGINPKDEIEGLLATQMVGVHNLAMEYMRRAMISEQTTEGVTINTERATKMLRTFTTQLEALNRHRGKSGQQKVVVEHVTVNSGGQAIVGQVNQNKSDTPEGGGN